MVQCVKRVLRHTIKEVAPRDHVLESFLIVAENIVNSRPLTHLPVDADQEAPLTPNDLLRGDMFCVCDPALPRREWRKGIIEEVYHGVDGVIRLARVRVSDNDLSRIIMRPVSKHAVLDLSEAVLHGVGDVDGR